MYNISFTITGKPGMLGRESWGNADDTGLAAKLYGQCQREAQEASRLAITCRSVNGKLCTYYHYLVSKDVTEAVSNNDIARNKKYGREGSFFAMSIRIDEAYCSNISEIYSLLRNVFDKEIIGNVLSNKDTGGFFVYQIEKLSEAEELFQKIDTRIRKHFSTSLLKDILSFNDFTLSPTGKIYRISIDNIDNEEITKLLLANSEIYVYEEYNNCQTEQEAKAKEATSVIDLDLHGNDESITEKENPNSKKSDTDEISNKLREKDTLIQILREQLSNANVTISKLQQSDAQNIYNRFNRVKQMFTPGRVKIIGIVFLLFVIGILIYTFIFNGCTNKESEQRDIAAIDTLIENTGKETKIETKKEDLESGISEYEPFKIISITFPGTAKTLEKGKPYILTAYATNAEGDKIAAKGVGKFAVENAMCFQDSMFCVIYIPYSSKDTLVKVRYNYRVEGVDTIIGFPKEYPVND